MSGTYRHLSLTDRIEIERMLSVCVTITAIAESTGFARQSIVREIVRGRSAEGRAKVYGRHWNGCVHQRSCRIRHACDWQECNRRCASCRNVNCVASCAYFSADSCPTLQRTPYCCNGCARYKMCAHQRLYYHANVADARAKELLVVSRRGIDLTEDECALVIRTALPLLRQGQSPAQIWTEHGDRMPCSERSFYRYVHQDGLTGICALDLPEAVTRKDRKEHRDAKRANLSKEALEGRTYSDFLLLDESRRARCAEMDCVCGAAGDDATLLTLFFRQWKFQLILLLAFHNADMVSGALDNLETYLCASFPDLILTDRGPEFAHAWDIESSVILAGRRSELYYCDPRRSDQKAGCERAHRLIRRVLPKGQSFEGLTDDDVALLTSHVNSVPRKSLGGKPPLLLAMEHLPKEFFEGFGIELIASDDVILKPRLLGL